MSLGQLRSNLRKLGLRPIPFKPVKPAKKRVRVIPQFLDEEQKRKVVIKLLKMQADGKLCVWANRDIVQIAADQDGQKVCIPWGKAYLIAFRGRVSKRTFLNT